MSRHNSACRRKYAELNATAFPPRPTGAKRPEVGTVPDQQNFFVEAWNFSEGPENVELFRALKKTGRARDEAADRVDPTPRSQAHGRCRQSLSDGRPGYEYQTKTQAPMDRTTTAPPKTYKRRSPPCEANGSPGDGAFNAALRIFNDRQMTPSRRLIGAAAWRAPKSGYWRF